MPMKNPPHVGRVIWHGIFEPLGLSITKAAEVLGVRRATLSDLVNGNAALTAEMALRIHKAFGPDIGHLLRMQAAYEAAKISKRFNSIKVKRYATKAA
jgi:antitoxin HigA-1